MTDSTPDLTPKQQDELKAMRESAEHMTREQLTDLLTEGYRQLQIKTKVLNNFMRKNIQLEDC